MTSEFPWHDVLNPLMAGDDLSIETARAAMEQIMAGAASDAQTAAFIIALRVKGETVNEMTGLVQAMRSASVSVDVGVPVVDIVGTGGDGAGTFNISTTAAFVAAGAGVKIAKHGNRAASSPTGSADLLERLGFDLELPPEATARMVRETNFGFFFAPRYHPAMRFAVPVRSQLKVRTVFNFLGPLCNPASAERYAIGVSDPQMAERMIHVLANLGAEAAFVYHGEDGLDELTTTGRSFIHRLREGEITKAEFLPSDFGVARATMSDLAGGGVTQNESITRDVLAGTKGPARDITLVNAAAAIVVAGLADGFAEGIELARAAIDSGDAQAALDRSAALSAELAAANAGE